MESLVMESDSITQGSNIPGLHHVQGLHHVIHAWGSTANRLANRAYGPKALLVVTGSSRRLDELLEGRSLGLSLACMWLGAGIWFWYKFLILKQQLEKKERS